VRSVVGRFLEHSRAYWFANAGDPKLYLSSADLMERNLDRRIETAFPITGKKLQARVRHALQLYLDDNSSASVLQADGQYQRVVPAPGAPIMNVQTELLRKLCVLEGGAGH
ncbi:MAG TPA: RNA degradosome polyphosphate kinase, partial [Rhodanobacter sp.]